MHRTANVFLTQALLVGDLFQENSPAAHFRKTNIIPIEMNSA